MHAMCIDMYVCVPCLFLCHCTNLMSLNKYDCQIVIMTQKAIMLNGHIDPIFFDICTKTQPTTICTAHVIAMYGAATNMPINVPYTQISSCSDMKQLCQYKYLI